jgi:hypothetical protein
VHARARLYWLQLEPSIDTKRAAARILRRPERARRQSRDPRSLDVAVRDLCRTIHRKVRSAYGEMLQRDWFTSSWAPAL